MRGTMQMEKEYELDLAHRRTDANLHELERQLFDLEGGAQGQIWPYQKIPSSWYPISWFHIANHKDQ